MLPIFLSQTGFNCYTFALGRPNEIRNPGYYSGRSLNLSSFSGIKLNVEQDQKSLGRSIYDTTVSQTIPYHSWKIALKIKSGYDYHFMSKDSNTENWRFKAGKGGPVMELLSGKNPSNVTWDQYSQNIFGKYKVSSSGYYNSEISYMMIRD